MSLQSVLLTGATGSVGAVVLEQLLATNVTVTAVLRSSAKSQPFLEKKYQKSFVDGHLKFIEIRDMSAPHVFDEPASTVSGIVHVATPLADSDFKKTMIDATWAIDHNVLSAAAKSPTVKRVIITGSVVSILNIMTDVNIDRTFSEKDFNSVTEEQGVTNAGYAYVYSKTAAEKKAWEFMKEEKRNFDLIFLLAPSITGRGAQEGYIPTKTSLGGMSAIYRNLFDVDAVTPMYPYMMDVDDVATFHVKSLDLTVPGNERYLFWSDMISSNEVANKIREKYPELKSRVPAGGEGKGWGEPLHKVDKSKADKVFGTKWKGSWESADATVADILAYEKSLAI